MTLKQAFGRSSLGLVLEEEEEDARFSFWSTELGLEQGDDKAKTRFKIGRREKNFKTRPSDVLTNQAAIVARRKQDLQDQTLTWGGGFNWRGPFRHSVCYNKIS